MESITELYRIGVGPSASHTMGPRRAADLFRNRYPGADRFQVTLYGSLAATGIGHLTDRAISDAFAPKPVILNWKPAEFLPLHPNGMEFEGFDPAGNLLGSWRVYSIGGGALREENPEQTPEPVYPLSTMAGLVDWSVRHQQSLWQYVEACETATVWEFLDRVWQTMKDAVRRGLDAEGLLPGPLRLERKSRTFYQKARRRSILQRTGQLYAYALAVSEENASGGLIVAAPTCGSCGVLPAVLFYLQDVKHLSDPEILKALATAGLIGNLVKTNGSISGAAVGCQGEIGTACAMAAGAATQLLGGGATEIEYAAEMGFEHHLGLTCDPVGGLVQIPCIERNAFAAARAMDAAKYALLAGGRHRISFDEVVQAMMETGADLKCSYRETSTGGLAKLHRPATDDSKDHR
jgi:L-serine dehydratase